MEGFKEHSLSLISLNLVNLKIL